MKGIPFIWKLLQINFQNSWLLEEDRQLLASKKIWAALEQKTSKKRFRRFFLKRGGASLTMTFRSIFKRQQAALFSWDNKQNYCESTQHQYNMEEG